MRTGQIVRILHSLEDKEGHKIHSNSYGKIIKILPIKNQMGTNKRFLVSTYSTRGKLVHVWVHRGSIGV